ELGVVHDADELPAGGGHDLLARERAAAALDELEVARRLVSAVHVHGNLVDAVQGDDRNAALAQALFRGLRACHGALDALLHPGEEVDEEVDGASRADADDHVVLDEGEGCLGCAPFLFVLRHGKFLSWGARPGAGVILCACSRNTNRSSRKQRNAFTTSRAGPRSTRRRGSRPPSATRSGSSARTSSRSFPTRSGAPITCAPRWRLASA